MLLHESERLQDMGFSTCLMGIMLSVATGLPWARVMFALSLFLQGVSQSTVLISYGNGSRGRALLMEKRGMAVHVVTVSFAAGLVSAAVGLMMLAIGL